MQNTGEYNEYMFSDYSDVVDKYSDLSFNEAEKLINTQSKAYEIYSVMQECNNSKSEEDIDYYLDILAQYQREEPVAYNSAENLLNADEFDNVSEEYSRRLYQQAEYIRSYPSFISEMKSRADNQASFSVFNNEDDFSYKNLYKTADDYKHLSDIKLTIGNDLPVTTAASYNITDCFLLIIVLLVCIYLFNQEKEQELVILIRCTKNGRLKTVSSKLLALFVITASVSIVFVLSNYIISSVIFGEIDLSRTIQSISNYRNCTFELSTGEFILLNVIVKAGALFVITSVFALLFTVLSNSTLIYILSAVFLLIEFAFYNLSSDTTFVSYFKYINILYALDGQNFFGSYRNLNIFSNPITANYLCLAVFFVVMLICISISIIAFNLIQNSKSKSIFAKLIDKTKDKVCRIKGSICIISGEVYKYLIMNKMGLVFLAVLAVSIFSSLNTASYPYEDKSDPAYKTYMEYLEGEITAEKENFIKKEQKYFDTLDFRLSELENDTSISNATREIAESTIYNIIESKGVAFDRVTEQYDRLLTLNSNGVNARFIDENLYPNLIFDSAREWSNSALISMLLILSLPFIFSVDYKNNTTNLIRSTKNGKLKIMLNKLLLVTLTALFSLLTVKLPYLISFVNTFGVKSLFTPIACIGEYKDVTGKINVFQTVMLNLCCWLFIALLISSVIILLSVIMKNHMLSVIISSGAVFIPLTLIYPNSLLRVGAVFNFNYPIIITSVILICIIMTFAFFALAAFKFTNTKRGDFLYAYSKNK